MTRRVGIRCAVRGGRRLRSGQDFARARLLLANVVFGLLLSHADVYKRALWGEEEVWLVSLPLVAGGDLAFPPVKAWFF